MPQILFRRYSTSQQFRAAQNNLCRRLLTNSRRPPECLLHKPSDSQRPAVGRVSFGPRALTDVLSSALRWHYATEDSDSYSRGLSETRANACEIVAWRFLTRLSEREAVDFCLYEIPGPKQPFTRDGADEEANEESSLLGHPRELVASLRRSTSEPVGSSNKRYQLLSSLSRLTSSLQGDTEDPDDEEVDPTAPFKSLNALEIAAIADAKRFLSQHVVQKIITGIWNGDIIFWDALSVKAEKKPRFYNARNADPYSRLRVPRYLKAWEILFFAVFLCLYYAVLVEQNTQRITPTEVVLYVWLAAFCYDELSEWIDAGSVFYAADIWNAFDMIMIAIGFAFAMLRKFKVRRRPLAFHG